MLAGICWHVAGLVGWLRSGFQCMVSCLLMTSFTSSGEVDSKDRSPPKATQGEVHLLLMSIF